MSQVNFDIIGYYDILKRYYSAMIGWNDGLKLGISSLDNEHKNILDIIIKLSEALRNNTHKDVTNKIFEELIKAIQEHSKHEESLLKQCNYKDLNEHTENHLNFLNSVKELKAKCCTSISIEEVTNAITDSFLIHILIEDFPLIRIFEEHGLLEQSKNKTHLFQQLLKKTTDTISFTKRILLSTLIPLIGMLILGFIILMDNYYKHEEMKKTSNITQVILNVNSIAHALQIERGLSSGHLSSSSDKFEKSLQEQRKVVNTAISSFRVKIESIHSHKLKIIHKNIETFNTDISTLKEFRQSILDKSLMHTQMMDFYNKVIKNILGITSKTASFNPDPKIQASISSLFSILQYKEALGQSRAYGTKLIERKKASTQEYLNFIHLLNTQKVFLELFNQSASPSQKERGISLVDALLNTNIYRYIQSIKNRDLHTLDSEVWFTDMTKYIDTIKIFENQLTDEINVLISNRLKKDVNNLILWIIYIGSIITITIFIIYLFERSSKSQLYKLSDAMKYLARGGRDLRLTPSPLKDEFSQMYNSYETTRQKLLEGDLYTELYKNQKEIELEKQRILNDRLEDLASIDPLTGCLNRRKFEELSNLELQRSSRHNNSLALLMLDIDLFKSINDTYGHAIGDEVLKHFSAVCLELARDVDIVARIGGEEFVVMLPHTDSDGAYIFAERFRKQIYNSKLTIDEYKIKYSVSIGISSFDIQNDTDIATILKRADSALYEAKESGRNKSVIK